MTSEPGQRFDVGCPDVLSCKEMIERSHPSAAGGVESSTCSA